MCIFSMILISVVGLNVSLWHLKRLLTHTTDVVICWRKWPANYSRFCQVHPVLSTWISNYVEAAHVSRYQNSFINDSFTEAVYSECLLLSSVCHTGRSCFSHIPSTSISCGKHKRIYKCFRAETFVYWSIAPFYQIQKNKQFHCRTNM